MLELLQKLSDRDYTTADGLHLKYCDEWEQLIALALEIDKARLVEGKPKVEWQYREKTDAELNGE